MKFKVGYEVRFNSGFDVGLGTVVAVDKQRVRYLVHSDGIAWGHNGAHMEMIYIFKTIETIGGLGNTVEFSGRKQMKLSEYIKEFGDKQVDVDKLSEFIIEDKVFVPKENEKYYLVDYVGEVSFYFNDDSIDKSIINCHQVYRTRAEAEFARDKAIFLEFMRKEFLRNSDVIDWGDYKQYKFSLDFDYYNNEITVDWCRSTKKGGFYTTDENWLRDFVDEHEDDIKKHYFEVNDDE